MTRGEALHHDTPVDRADRLVADVTGVVKRYGSTVALDGAGIRIRPGQTHALVGRNGAGKSTLVSILTGLQAPDAGTVLFDGEPAPALADRDAWRRRVACVYQKSTVIPTLTVAENLFLNRHPRRPGALIRWRALRREATTLLTQWSVDVDVNQPASTLSVEQRQFVEIARALSFGARFVILDEPTAQLDSAGIERLFERIRDLQRQGVTFLFISHHLQEVYDICDTVTVFRDARHIMTAPVSEVTTDALVTAMTGDDIHLTPPGDRPPISDAPVALQIDGLVTGGAHATFQIRRGESVGLAGGGGSGKVEVAETLVGLRRAEAGTIAVSGRTLRPGSVPASLHAGVGLVPQDRHTQGLIPLMSVADNMTLTVPEKLGPAGFIRPDHRDRLAEQLIADLAIKTSGPAQPVSGLSGGNQQKVVLGRALASDPSVLILITPTAGVDVRSKQTLLATVDAVCADGTAVLIVSDELDDLRGCDRVLVMFQGRITHEIPRGWRDGDLVAAMEGIELGHE